jgi:TrmH family RNA methyltransferase
MSQRITRIRSENSTYQIIDSLRRNREKRQKHRLIFVEGVRNVDNALAYDWPTYAYVYSPERLLSDWAKGILSRSTAEHHFEVSPGLLEQLSGKTDTSELMSLVEMPDDSLARIPIQSDLLVVVFDRPASPGNLGTLIRSCDALGADGMVVTGHGVDLYDPETISAATGSLFALPVVRKASHEDLLPWIEQLRRKLGSVQIVGTDESGTTEVSRHDFSSPTILLIGNERWGLSAAYREMADSLVTIPMRGSASSLNVAVAASIVLFEIDRQRRNRAS